MAFGTFVLSLFFLVFKNIKKLKYLAVIFSILKVYHFITLKYYKTVEPVI